MRLVTFNINGIRARMPRLIEYLQREQPDVACLQELKCADDALPIGEIEAAIKVRDSKAFATAFDKLTGACNSCHEAANRGFIVIQRPTASAFPNQSFAPKRK